MTLRRSPIVFVLCLSTLVCAPAFAADATDVDRQAADRFVIEGKKLGEAGRVMEAIERFKAAETRYPRAIHGCNIGLAYAQLKSFPQALLFLEQCRSRATGPLPAWVEARYQKTLETLRAGGYGAVEILTEPSGADVQVVGFAKDETFAAPRTVWIAAGDAEVIITRDGYVTERRTLQVTAQAQRLQVKLQRVPVARTPDPVTPPPTHVEPPSATQPLTTPPPAVAPRGRLSLKIAGGALISVSTIALFAAWAPYFVDLKNSTVSRNDDGQPMYAERRQAFLDKKNTDYFKIYPAIFVSTGIGILAGVGLVVAGTLLPSSKSSSVSAVVLPTPSNGGATMSVVGRF